MQVPVQLKDPSTYAGLGVVFASIPRLLATGGADPTAWAAIIGGLVAIFTRSRSDQAS